MTFSYFIDPLERYGNELYSFSECFRSIAFEIDKDPLVINSYYHLPVFDFLVSDRDSSTLDRTLYLEALAYGDPSVLLASPGPSLSGLMIRELGTSDQVERFFSLLKKNKMK